MAENDVNPPLNNDPVEKRNEFIDHPSYFGYAPINVFPQSEEGGITSGN